MQLVVSAYRGSVVAVSYGATLIFQRKSIIIVIEYFPTHECSSLTPHSRGRGGQEAEMPRQQSISRNIALEGQRVAGSGKCRFRSEGPAEPFKYSELVRMSENRQCELCRRK